MLLRPRRGASEKFSDSFERKKESASRMYLGPSTRWDDAIHTTLAVFLGIDTPYLGPNPGAGWPLL